MIAPNMKELGEVTDVSSEMQFKKIYRGEMWEEERQSWMLQEREKVNEVPSSASRLQVSENCIMIFKYI